MSGDDCIKVIEAIAAAQVAMVVALGTLYVKVRGNGQSLERLERVQAIRRRVKPSE